MLSILVVSQYYFPEPFRISDICEELARRGHKVTVLTGQPNYPDGVIYEGYESIESVEEHNGVEIIRCKIHPRHTGSFNLFLNYLSFVKSASRKIKTINDGFDLIYVYQLSPVTSALPAIRLKKNIGIPIFLYCCDIWPDSVRDSVGEPMSLKNPIYKLAKWISKYIYERVDRIGVKCNQFADYLHDVCGIDKEKCCLIYEHAESSYLAIPEEPKDNGCFDFVFLGNIGSSQHCDYIVRAVEKIRTSKKFKLHFVGSGSELKNLQDYVEKKAMTSIVVFHGRYPVSEINRFYEFADCCILTLSAKTATGLTPPAKLVGYMAASRPVIAAAVGATSDIIKNSGCGICVNSEDIDGLASAMNYALDNQDEFRKKGKSGRSYFINNFTLKKHVDSLEMELNNAFAGKSC